jgi:hypothetical protein
MNTVYGTNPNSRGSHDVPLMIRGLYIKHPEMRGLEPWELQSALFVLGYIDGLLDEGEIAVAVEVARTDIDLDEGAA